jgi:STE24 endopeptidase
VNSTFAWAFLVAVALSTGTRLWLAARQARHVRAHRGEVPAAFAGEIPLAAHQKAADYTVAKARLAMAEAGVSAALVLALTLGGLLQRLSEAWSAIAAPDSLAHGVALIVSAVLAQGALEIPLSLYRSFVVEARFGFNRMTLGLFFADLLKGAVVGVLLGVPLLLAVLWLMRESGALWWLYAWLVVVAYTAFVQMIYPAVVMPWFNKFSPLRDAALAGRLEKLLARCGFRSRGLYEMDGSKRSAHGNAFFSGFGAGKRIVLFDTLVSRLVPGEVEAVLAHELGHYKLNHIRQGMFLSWAMSLAMLYALGQVLAQPWFYEGLGMRTASQGAGLLLFMLVAPEFLFFLRPLTSLFSRRREFEADRYATQNASAQDLESALVKLYKDNAATLTPDPIHSAFYDSHPPAAIRIARLRAA